MIENGYFILSRLIFESEIWKEDPNVLKIFIYLIGNARHDKKPKKYPGFQVNRGELVTSLSQIADDNEYMWHGQLKKLSRAKVSRILHKLKNGEYISILADTYGTHISICNYEDYQNPLSYKADTTETEVDTTETQMKTNNNDNNVKKGKKEKHTGSKNEPGPSDKKVDYIDSLLENFCTIYQENRNDEFIVSNHKKERSGIAGLLKHYKKVNPNSNTEKCTIDFIRLFKDALSITFDENKWLYNKMSPSILLNSINEIKQIVKNRSKEKHETNPAAARHMVNSM